MLPAWFLGYDGSASVAQAWCPHLIDPVGVEDAQAADLAADALLRQVLQVPRRLQRRDALVHRLAVHDTLQAETGRWSVVLSGGRRTGTVLAERTVLLRIAPH